MEIKLPPLFAGQVYFRADLRACTMYEDLLGQRFPRDIEDWDAVDVLAFRADAEPVFEYAVWEFERFRPQAVTRRSDFLPVADDWARVVKVMDLLKAGEVAYPVIVQYNDPLH